MADADSILEFELIDDPYDIGRPRLDENIGQVEASGFSIILRQKLAVHGQWTAKGEPASLLIYRLELHNQSPTKNRRFKNLVVKFRLEKDPKTTPSEDPWVDSYCPAQGTVLTLLPTSVQETRDRTFSGSVEIDGQLVPAKFAAAYENTASSQYERHARVSIAGAAMKTLQKGGIDRKGDDRIEWNIKENPYEMEIPDSYGLCILVRRQDEAKFKVHFEFKATVDWWYDIKSKVAFSGLQQKFKSYDPSDKPKGKVPDGVDSQELGLLSSEEGPKLANLFEFSHLPAEMQPIKVISSREE